jgi:hypothetical protein
MLVARFHDMVQDARLDELIVYEIAYFLGQSTMDISA